MSVHPLRAAQAHLIIDKQGFAWLPEEDFAGHFAADVDPVRARVMWAVQQPLSAVEAPSSHVEPHRRSGRAGLDRAGAVTLRPVRNNDLY